MTTLVKTQSVLDLDLVSKNKGEARFTYLEDEPTGRLRAVHVDHETFVELGEPHQITVTVEPGDALTPQVTQDSPWVSA